MRVEITDAVIPAVEILAEMKAGADGAVCVFDGIVRDNTRGRRTLHLDYEAYREMALEQMRALTAEAVSRFGVRDVALVHRLGRLLVGETSVLVVVASAHRGAAFDACRWLIDTLKKTVPIWKKEQFVDGAVWADGEPFPVEIGLPSAPMAGARLADGEPFPSDIGVAKVGDLGDESGSRIRANAHLSAIEPREDGAPGSVGDRKVVLEESGRASHDTPPFAKGAKDAAPGSVGDRKVVLEESGCAADGTPPFAEGAKDGAPGSLGDRRLVGRGKLEAGE